jgi:hypothetical protein
MSHRIYLRDYATELAREGKRVYTTVIESAHRNAAQDDFTLSMVDPIIQHVLSLPELPQDFTSHFDYLMKCQLAADKEKEKVKLKVGTTG